MKPKIKTTCTKLQLQLLSFCLLCLSGKTRCDGNGPAVVTVEQGSDAVLPCSLSSKENIEFHLFDWKKPAQIDGGQKKVFYYDAGIHYNNGRAGQSEEFKGRVSHFPEELKHGNASIIIRNTTVADSGNYTCVFPNLQPRQTFHIDLVVAKKPFITTLEQTKDWSRLQCEVQGASPKPKVEWKDSSGNILPAEKTQVTDRGGSYDIILQTTVTKTDYYHCVVTQGENHQIEAKINVHISGAAPKPNIEHLDETDNRALLQCEANGNPQPEVEWRDSAGNKLPAQEPQFTQRDGRFYVTLNTAVTKTDRYRCVATQKTISHQIYAETFVRLNGAAPKPSIAILDATKDSALLQCEVHGNPQPEVEWRDSAGNKLPAEEPQVSERHGRFYVTLNTIVTKTDHYQCVATQKTISHQIYAETFVRLNVPDPPTGWIVAGVLCAVNVVGGAAFAIWRHKKKTPNKGSPADPKEGSEVPLNGRHSQS